MSEQRLGPAWYAQRASRGAMACRARARCAPVRVCMRAFGSSGRSCGGSGPAAAAAAAAAINTVLSMFMSPGRSPLPKPNTPVPTRPLHAALCKSMRDRATATQVAATVRGIVVESQRRTSYGTRPLPLRSNPRPPMHKQEAVRSRVARHRPDARPAERKSHAIADLAFCCHAHHSQSAARRTAPAPRQGGGRVSARLEAGPAAIHHCAITKLTVTPLLACAARLADRQPRPSGVREHARFGGRGSLRRLGVD